MQFSFWDGPHVLFSGLVLLEGMYFAGWYFQRNLRDFCQKSQWFGRKEMVFPSLRLKTEAGRIFIEHNWSLRKSQKAKMDPKIWLPSRERENIIPPTLEVQQKSSTQDSKHTFGRVFFVIIPWRVNNGSWGPKLRGICLTVHCMTVWMWYVFFQRVS